MQPNDITKSRRCAACGYRSASQAFFRRERSKASGLKWTFCAACGPYAASQLELATYINAFVMTPVGLLISMFADSGVARLGYFFLFFGVIDCSHLVTCVAHEVGHAALASAVGMRVVTIAIGTGPILASRPWRDTTIEFRWFLLAGGRTVTYHQMLVPRRWRHALMLAGGVLGNMVVAGVMAALLALLAMHSSPSFAVVVAAYAVITGQLVTILINLAPITFRFGPSDGRQLLRLVVRKDFRERQLVQRIVLEGMALLKVERYEEALAHVERGCDALPANGHLLSLLIHTAGKSKGPRAAVEYYRGRASALRTGSAADRAGAAWASVNGAWHALLCGDQESVSLADQLSRQVVEVLPDNAVVQATRGAVLVELGEHEAGLRLLVPAIRRIESRDDRLCFVSFLAKGERVRGNFDMAVEFENFGRHLAGAA